MMSSSRPRATNSWTCAKSSRLPLWRLVVRRAPLASARTLPASRVSRVRRRSASPKLERRRTKASARYTRGLATGASALQAGDELDDHLATLEVNTTNDVLYGRQQ